MDKWSNPLRILLTLDAIALVAGGLLIRRGVAKIKQQEQPDTSSALHPY
jgi:general stress protein CsbA